MQLTLCFVVLSRRYRFTCSWIGWIWYFSIMAFLMCHFCLCPGAGRDPVRDPGLAESPGGGFCFSFCLASSSWICCCCSFAVGLIWKSGCSMRRLAQVTDLTLFHRDSGLSWGLCGQPRVTSAMPQLLSQPRVPLWPHNVRTPLWFPAWRRVLAGPEQQGSSAFAILLLPCQALAHHSLSRCF